MKPIIFAIRWKFKKAQNELGLGIYYYFNEQIDTTWTFLILTMTQSPCIKITFILNCAFLSDSL